MPMPVGTMPMQAPPQQPPMLPASQAAYGQRLLDGQQQYGITHRQLGLGHCCGICGPFMQIEPLLRHPDGVTTINPLFDVVRVFHLALTPFPVQVGPGAPTGDSVQASLQVQAEENQFGDLIVSELLADVAPTTARFAVSIENRQNDRIYMNTPILDRFVFANGQLSHNLPCCFLIQATNFAQFTVEAVDPVLTTVKISARGQRFLPYMYPGLREQLLNYWNNNKTTPYYLGIDSIQGGPQPSSGINLLVGGGVSIPAHGTVTCFMKVPGAGDFEYKEPRTLVEGVGGVVTAADVDVTITEGVGRSLMSAPIPLDMVAQPNTTVVGLEGGELRAASGGHRRFFTQFMKRNTQVRVVLTNNTAFAANVWFCVAGCMHYYDECPPNPTMSRSLSLEPTVGPILMQAPPCPPIQSFQPVAGQGMVPVGGGAPAIRPPLTGYNMPAYPGGPTLQLSGLGMVGPRFPMPQRRGFRAPELPDGGRYRGGNW